MRLRFLWIGKTKDPFFSRVEDRYLERLQQFFSVERTAVPDLRKTDQRLQSAQMSREAQLIQKKLSDSYLIVLDERGKQYTTLEFASFLQNLMNQGKPQISFLVGGHQGIPDKIKGLANLRLSLSTLTLPHEMARMVLLEQVYRAVSILRGMPYHK